MDTALIKNKREAVRLFRIAADSGNSEGQAQLGWCYRWGWIVEKDVVQAVRLFQLAVAGGSWVGHVWLGHCYMYGDGIEKSMEEALRLYQLAAQNHDDSGDRCFGGLRMEFGNGVPRDEEKAD